MSTSGTKPGQMMELYHCILSTTFKINLEVCQHICAYLQETDCNPLVPIPGADNFQLCGIIEGMGWDNRSLLLSTVQ